MGVGLRGRVEVLVRFPGQAAEAAETVRFDADKSLEDQLAGLCVLRDVPYNQDENYQVLVGTGGSCGSSAGVVLSSVRALGALPARASCELRPGVEVAHAQLSRIEVASRSVRDPARRGETRVALGMLLRSMQDSTWFAEEVIAQDGIQILLDVLVLVAALHGEQDEEVAAGDPGTALSSSLSLSELAASCIGELLQYENGVAWCEQCSEQVMHADVFTALLCGVLGAGSGRGMAMPKATLGFALFLLATLPATATSGFHEAASANGDALYRRLIEACLQRHVPWRNSACSALFAALLEAVQETPHLAASLGGAVRRAAESEEAKSFVAELLGQGALEHQAHWIQHLLSDTLATSGQAACGALEVEAALVYAGRMARKAKEGAAQDTRRAMLEKRLSRLEEEVRRTHLALRSMVRLVNLAEHPFLRENLEVIVRTGFDSVLWEKGYTALHYAAEAVDDLNVVEMLCHLASNLKAPDDQGIRPAEYALRAGKGDVAELIQGLSQQREERSDALSKQRRGQGGSAQGLPPPVNTISLGSGEAPTASILKRRSVTFESDVQRQPSNLSQATRSEGPALRWASGFAFGGEPDGEGYDDPLRVLARQLRGFLFKSATSGAWYARTQRRYFAMTSVPCPPPGVPAPHYELGYWESDDAFRNGSGAKGSVNARQIIEVSHGQKGLAEASLAIKFRDGQNVKELVVMAKDERGLPSASDAQRWADLLREFCKALAEESPPLPPPTHSFTQLDCGVNEMPHAPTETATAQTLERNRLLAAATARTREIGGNPSTLSISFLTSPHGSPSGSFCLPPDACASVRNGEAAAMALPLDSTMRRRRSSAGRAPRGAQVRVRLRKRSSAVEREGDDDDGGEGEGESPHRQETFSLDLTEDGYDSDPGPGGQPAVFRMNSASSEAQFERQPQVFRIASFRSTVQQEAESDPETMDFRRQPHVLPTYSTERLYERSSWVLDQPEQPRIESAYSSERLYEDTSWLDIPYQSRGLRRQRMAAEFGVEEDVGGAGTSQPSDGLPLGVPVFAMASTDSRQGDDQSSGLGPPGGGLRRFPTGAERHQEEPPVGLRGDAAADLAQASSPSAERPHAPGGDAAAPVEHPAEAHGSLGAAGGSPAPAASLGGAARPGVDGQAAGDRPGDGGSAPSEPPRPGAVEADGPATPAKALSGGADSSGTPPQTPGQNSTRAGKGSKGPPPPPLSSQRGMSGSFGKGQASPSAPSPKGTSKGSPSPGGKGGKAGPPPPKAGPKAPPPGKGKGGSKGAGDEDEDKDLRKPCVNPTRPMKALWWTRFLYGRHLKDGDSVWDKIQDFNLDIPKEVFESRFGKPTHASAAQKVGRRKPDGGATKELRITTDPNKIVGKEGALRDFPPAEAVAQALMELDSLVLDQHRLASVKDHFCPTPHEVTLLEDLRKEKPDIPFAPPERYMWHVSRVPAYRARVECWTFMNSFKERAATYAAALAEFQRVEDSILSSRALPRLLALILWVGNYLNGGTKRGRADGFDLETLTKLDSVKDNHSQNGSRDIRHFIFELFFLGVVNGIGDAREDPAEAQDSGARLLEDFIPLFRIVNRTVMRAEEAKVVKTVKVVLEDVEKDVQELAGLFANRQESLLECLKYSDDPADPMKLVMAEQFAEARPCLLKLEAQAKKCRDSYAKLLSHFNHPGMKTSDFVLLWDDFFIPADLILNKPEALQKSEILPNFCRPQVTPSVDSLMVLWDIRTPEEICQVAAARRKRGPPRRRAKLHGTSVAANMVAARCARHWRKRASMSGDQLSA